MEIRRIGNKYFYANWLHLVVTMGYDITFNPYFASICTEQTFTEICRKKWFCKLLIKKTPQCSLKAAAVLLAHFHCICANNSSLTLCSVIQKLWEPYNCKNVCIF